MSCDPPVDTTNWKWKHGKNKLGTYWSLLDGDRELGRVWRVKIDQYVAVLPDGRRSIPLSRTDAEAELWSEARIRIPS